jgi:hypothetical protein
MVSSKKLFLYCYTILCFYILLVIIDIIVPRYDFFNKNSQEAKDRIKSYQVIVNKMNEQHTKVDADLLPISYPVYYELLPFRSIVKKHNFVPLGALPNQKTYISSEGLDLPSIYTSDRFGFRNNDDIWDNLNSVEAIVIGDSAIAGHGALNNQTIPAIFNQNNLKTINLGLGGYSGKHYEFLAKIFIPIIKPKVVFLVFHGNDNHLIDLLEIHEEFIDKSTIDDYFEKGDVIQPSLKAKKFYKEVKDFIIKTDISNYNQSFVNKVIKLKKYLFLTNIRKVVYNLYYRNNKPVPSSIDAINEVVNQCNIHKCDLRFALIKSSDYWDPDSSYDDYEKTLASYLDLNFQAQLLKSNDIIDQTDLTNWGKQGPHFSPKGYKTFSDYLLKSLK